LGQFGFHFIFSFQFRFFRDIKTIRKLFIYYLFIFYWVVGRFTMHNLVWTTLKPLVDLLEAEHEAVNELGCFLIACLSRTNQQTSKLFHEGTAIPITKMTLNFGVELQRRNLTLVALRLAPGAVSTLERLAQRRDQPTVRQLARIALTNLGVNVLEPLASPSSCPGLSSCV
jgi:hypothetical protein